MNGREWDICLSDIRDIFGDLLRNAQIDAVNTIATVYLWFARTSAAGSDDGRDIPGLWKELQELMMNAAVMGVWLDTPGEALIRNVEGWARSNIAVRTCRKLNQRDISEYNSLQEALSVPVFTRGPNARAITEERVGDSSS